MTLFIPVINVKAWEGMDENAKREWMKGLTDASYLRRCAIIQWGTSWHCSY
ncbi:tautomerase family protein [Terrilactibacillus tamarindi]|uniref:tautomerase family protein n=1 Tax=Terrilactibacillus tamarindi TaxID=2599694 RepID=UPI001E47F0FF|nr:hypothetical protein [Terrilactibacillus tamarindi]